MRHTVRFIACAALALLLFSAALAESAPAGPDPSAFPTIRVLLAALDEAGMAYEDISPNSTGEYAHIAVLAPRDDETIVFSCFLGEATMHVYGWKLVTVNPDRLLEAYQTINALNREERWGTFVLDTSDNTVQIEYDLFYYDDESFTPPASGCFNA